MGLFGSRRAQSATAEVTMFDGHDSLAVVGESHYQDAIWRDIGGQAGVKVQAESIAYLVPEPENPHDRHAVAVLLRSGKAGYLARDDAREIGPGLRALISRHRTHIGLRCSIIGGGPNPDGTSRSLGVWLFYDPTDFGLPATDTSAGSGSVRTGESTAGIGDWLSKLPEDSVKRITMLRKLLAEEQDPLARHYMYDYLEVALYRARDVFPSALSDYESVATSHDAEMDRIAPALIARFGGMPLLGSYKQLAILKTKQKDHEAARVWVRKGLALYGDRCIAEGAVADLENRLAKLDAKLGVEPAVAAVVATEPIATTSPAVPAAWHPDPLGRYDHRWWDGTQWTANVATNGVVAVDPIV